MKIRAAESELFAYREHLIGNEGYEDLINALTFALYLIDKEQSKKNGIREVPDYDFDLEE